MRGLSLAADTALSTVSVGKAVEKYLRYAATSAYGANIGGLSGGSGPAARSGRIARGQSRPRSAAIYVLDLTRPQAWAGSITFIAAIPAFALRSFRTFGVAGMQPPLRAPFVQAPERLFPKSCAFC